MSMTKKQRREYKAVVRRYRDVAKAYKLAREAESRELNAVRSTAAPAGESLP